MPRLHTRDILDANGNPVLRLDHDVFDLFNIHRPADAVHQQHLTVLRDVASPDIPIVGTHGLDDLVEHESMLDQLLRIDADLVLLFIPAPTVHFGRPGNRSKLRFDDPVVDRSKLRQFLAPDRLRQLRQIDTLQTDDVVKNLPQPRRYRPHLGTLDPLGKLHGPQPFIDQLPRKVDIGAVFEDDHDLRKTEFRNRPQLFQSRQPADDLLDGKRNLSLYFLR